MAKLVSQTYGEALYMLAVEEEKSLLYLEEAKMIRQILEENPDFLKLMMHPAVSVQEKVSLVRQAFEGKVSPQITGFLELLIQKGRIGSLDEILACFIEKVKAEQKIGVAYVTTAEELTEQQKDRVQARLMEITDFLTMEMHYLVDRQLIGGMVIRIGDRIVDNSIRSKLNDLTGKLLRIQPGEVRTEGKAQ